jgi:hypothetical protein
MPFSRDTETFCRLWLEPHAKFGLNLHLSVLHWGLLSMGRRSSVDVDARRGLQAAGQEGTCWTRNENRQTGVSADSDSAGLSARLDFRFR